MSKYLFNDAWKFMKKGGSSWENVRLPHDAMIYEKREPNCKNGMNTGYFPGGIYIYEKAVTLPPNMADKAVWLEFEGVYGESTLWVNSKTAGKKAFGYGDFSIRIDPMLHPGTENVIRVEADNSKEPNSRWYSGSGIYRPVWLHVKDNVRVAMNGIRVRTVSLLPAVIEVEVILENDTEQPFSGNISMAIYEKNNKECQNAATGFDVTIPPKGSVQQTVRVEMKDGKPWSEHRPDLYICQVSLGDYWREQVTFGLRTLEWSAARGLLVNGIETKLKGACVHHDLGLLGAANFPAAEKRRVRLLKSMGYNAIRSSHNPMSKAMLKACDELGVYVMDELYDMWFIHKNPYDYASYVQTEYIRDITEMVQKDMNHPSVIIYSIGNEISETAGPEGIAFGKKLIDIFHQQDASRPVTSNLNFKLNSLAALGLGIYKNKDEGEKKTAGSVSDLSGSALVNFLSNKIHHLMEKLTATKLADRSTRKICELLDICGYSYGTARYVKDFKHYPQRILCGSETYIRDLPLNWVLMQKHKNLIGDFVWTGWDYLGEAGIGAFEYVSMSTENTGYFKGYPWLFANTGMMDATGYPTPHAFFSKVIYEQMTKPYIAVSQANHAGEKHNTSSWNFTNALNSWSYRGFEGRTVSVEIYSAAPWTEVFVNGTSIGKKPCGPRAGYRTLFETCYENGEIKAVAYDDSGLACGETVLRTAGATTVLHVDTENESLMADGEDLCYINIELTDEDCICKVTEDVTVSVTVTGAGTLAALGSARGCTQEGFHSGHHKTYHGRAQAIVRAGGEPGEIYVHVRAEGYEEKTLTIPVVCRNSDYGR